MQYGQHNKGFTILLATIVASIVLAIGATILNVTLKTFTLSVIARESHFAFYGADSGLECAFYWDKLPAGTAFRSSGVITCGGQVININPVESPANTFTTNFSVDNLIGGGDYCAEVEVIKRGGVSTSTVVISRGYNTCNLNSPQRVERALRSLY